MITVTIACPAAHIADANQLARVIGYGADDDRTYGEAAWQDADGNLYAVASGPVSPTFPAAAASPLVEPEWGADMAAAARAQALVAAFDPAGVEGELPDMAAQPGRITAIIHDDPQQALAWLGLVRITETGVAL